MSKGHFPCDAHPGATATPGGRCRECNREYQARWYGKPENREIHLVRVRDVHERAKAKARDFVWGVLSMGQCADCGEDDPIVLQFDHVRGKKLGDVSQMICHGVSVARIKSEVEKCEIVCANCHIRRSSESFGWWKFNRIDSAGDEAALMKQ